MVVVQHVQLKSARTVTSHATNTVDSNSTCVACKSGKSLVLLSHIYPQGTQLLSELSETRTFCEAMSIKPQVQQPLQQNCYLILRPVYLEDVF